MNMNRAVGVALIIIGVVLLIWGVNASNSFGSEVSEAFTGSPTDRAIWLIVGGIASAVVGLFLTLRAPARRI
jgi:cytosine/uracil/thiamine/allantoin permease